MKRIALFAATNIAVMVVLALVMNLLGIQSILDESGTSLDLQSLLIFSAVIGFSGSLISLAISKWMAKRMTGAHVIETPANEAEAWLVQTVSRQAQQAGIRCPEVAIYDAPDMNAFATGATRNSALVAVSTGLLRNMDRNAVEAVLGQERGEGGLRDLLHLGAAIVDVRPHAAIAPRRVPRSKRFQRLEHCFR